MKRKAAFIAGVLLSIAAAVACAQSYPQKPIRVIVPFPAGGTADMIARTLSQRLAENLGQSVIVDNRSGSNGIIGTEVVAKSPPDGYTLLMAPSGHAINNSLNANVPYDPVRDFETITLVGTVPMVVTMHHSVPAKTVKELITLAKARPGGLTFGSGGPGSSNQLATELFATRAGIKMVHIPYRGDTPGIADLLGGHIDFIFLNIPAALPLVKADRLRGLAITSAKRSELLPGVPTIAETVPAYEAGSWHGFYAPAKTSKAIVTTLNSELVKILRTPKTKDFLSEQGISVVGDSPEEFSRFLKGEIEKWAAVIKVANVKL